MPNPKPERRASGKVARAPTVLVAEDDEDLRALVRRFLMDDGFVVIEAATGNAALEYLARAADDAAALPDVLLLDFVLPGLSGLGILRVMRRFKRAPATVIMTAFPDPSVDRFALNLGAVRVLRKPIDADELHDALVSALSVSERATNDR
jgi:DNA-binding response OmpR family regulator